MDVYEIITDKIIAQLEHGTIPWRKPWSTEPPANLKSKKPYRGVNVFLLATAPFASPYWVTFRQAREVGGSVRAGEKGRPVVFWTWYETGARGVKDPSAGSPTPSRPARPSSRTSDPDHRRVPVLRYYTVFNIEQCDDIAPPPPTGTPSAFVPIERAEAIVVSMPDPPRQELGRAAFYTPATDTLTVPAREAFSPLEEYYATLFHELGHASGHPRRLDRASLTEGHAFGTHGYSREELVAEMTAAFLCGHAGIDPVTLPNAAAYIVGWLKVLRGDVRMVVQAAAAAQKAADFILGVTFPDAEQTE